MDKSLYYEVTGITKPVQVEKAYKHAVDNNFKYYRCVSGTGKVYGWINNNATKAHEGQEWFENANYKATENATQNTTPIVEKAVPDVKATTTNVQTAVHSALETIKHEAEKYEELYNSKCVDYAQLEKKAIEQNKAWQQKYNAANAEWETKNNNLVAEWEKKYNALKADHDAMAHNYNIIMKAAKVFVTLANDVKEHK